MISLLLVATLGALVSSKTVTYDFDIGWVRAAPDGYSRPVIGINGKWPIPTIDVDMNDDVVVNVRNSLGNRSTSLHFHGMWQQGTNAFDGGVGLSQCAISPGDSYTYRFRAYPAGTHWYHSHEKGQYPDGLRGKMIVHDRAWEKSLNIHQQMYYSMSDWYHREQVYIIHDYLSPTNTNGDFPSPDSFLFNDGRNPPDLTFEPKKRYLLRIVNVAGVACGRFHIDGVTLSVVEIDGVQVQPTRANTIVVCAGQSYAVVVTGKSNPISGDNYIVKMTTETLPRSPPAESAITCIGRVRYNFLGRLITTILNILRVSWQPQDVLDDMTLRPTDNQRLLAPVQNDIQLRSNQTFYPGIGTRTGIGAQPWVEPKLPSLYTALTTGRFAFDPNTYGPGADPWVLRSGEVVQIYLENPQAFPHPMHLHGHVFQVVARGTGTWDENESRLPRVPMKRNNVMVPANGYVVLRFKADNPGVWFFHCHIDLHLVGGMASTMIEAPDVLQRRQSIPDAGAALCERRRQCTTGNCACGNGAISGSDAAAQCNTIFNS